MNPALFCLHSCWSLPQMLPFEFTEIVQALYAYKTFIYSPTDALVSCLTKQC